MEKVLWDTAVLHTGDTVQLRRQLCLRRYREVIPALSGIVLFGTLSVQVMPKMHLKQRMWEWSRLSCFERRVYDSLP